MTSISHVSEEHVCAHPGAELPVDDRPDAARLTPSSSAPGQLNPRSSTAEPARLFPGAISLGRAISVRLPLAEGFAAGGGQAACDCQGSISTTAKSFRRLTARCVIIRVDTRTAYARYSGACSSGPAQSDFGRVASSWGCELCPLLRCAGQSAQRPGKLARICIWGTIPPSVWRSAEQPAGSMVSNHGHWWSWHCFWLL